MDEGIIDSITPDGLRYIARTRKDWPFGPGRKHPYVRAGNARTMATGPFLDYLSANPPTGRGPAAKAPEAAQ